MSEGEWSEEDAEVYELTKQERDAGGLIGAFTPQQLAEKLGARWVPARRFPVVQGGKVRPIDDFSFPVKTPPSDQKRRW